MTGNNITEQWRIFWSHEIFASLLCNKTWSLFYSWLNILTHRVILILLQWNFAFRMQINIHSFKISKVLMIHNRRVDFVNFHVMHGVNPEKIVTTLQRKLETWSGISCPKWSRFAAAPFTVEVISKDRKRRSIEDSRQRNEARKRKRDWERDWILQSW